jgi:hypothetical protein
VVVVSVIVLQSLLLITSISLVDDFGSIIQKKKKTRKIINGTYFDNGELDNKSFGILHKAMNVDKKTKEREKTAIPKIVIIRNVNS